MALAFVGHKKAGIVFSTFLAGLGLRLPVKYRKLCQKTIAKTSQSHRKVIKTMPAKVKPTTTEGQGLWLVVGEPWLVLGDWWLVVCGLWLVVGW